MWLGASKDCETPRSRKCLGRFALSRNPASQADEGQLDVDAHVMQTSALQNTDI